MRGGWERLAKLMALLLPAVALVAFTADPLLKANIGDAVTWSSLTLGLTTLAWLLVLAYKIRRPPHGGRTSLQDLERDDQKMVKQAWLSGAPVPTNLVDHVRQYGRNQEVALHRGGWSLAAMGLFNLNTAFAEGTLRWLGIAVVVYLAALGLALDLVLARWRRVLRGLPSDDWSATRPR